MIEKKMPETDEERLEILQAIIYREDVARESDKLLNEYELQSLRNFVASYEASVQFILQAKEDEKKALELYRQNMNNAKLYVSHFIQVLLMTVQRGEIKQENLSLYGFDGFAAVNKAPDVSTRDSLLKWGENIIKGEAERIGKGGFPLYNPAIAKVKVHFELFKESYFSLDIFKKNLIRLQGNMTDFQTMANDYISDVWTKAEEKYAKYPPTLQATKYRDLRIQPIHQKPEQLNVFN